jgi:hypothetical protein
MNTNAHGFRNGSLAFSCYTGNEFPIQGAPLWPTKMRPLEKYGARGATRPASVGFHPCSSVFIRG